jgi:hypothetical protein
LPGTASFNAKRGRATTVGGLAVTPEGGVFAVVNQTADVGNGTITLKQSQLEVLQPKRRAVKVRGSTGAKARQAVYGDADTDHLVWMETTSTDLTHQPWVLLLSVRRSGVTRVLASSPEDAPAPPSGTVPTLAEGRVYWSAAQRTRTRSGPFARTSTAATLPAAPLSGLRSRTR